MYGNWYEEPMKEMEKGNKQFNLKKCECGEGIKKTEEINFPRYVCYNEKAEKIYAIKKQKGYFSIHTQFLLHEHQQYSLYNGSFFIFFTDQTICMCLIHKKTYRKKHFECENN